MDRKVTAIGYTCAALLFVAAVTVPLVRLGRKVNAAQQAMPSFDPGYAMTSAIPTKLSQLANDTGYALTSAIPTKLSQLTNDAGFLNNSTAVTGTITVPATLLSLGSSVTPVTNASVAAGTFYLCAFNTTNNTGQVSLDVLANAMSNGTLNVILKNTSATTLTGGYTVNYKCIQQ